MKKRISRIRGKLSSVLRPNQRRNWSKDQIHHYQLFLDDYRKIKEACDARINGIEIHNLLEKEIRNSYWIYRSSSIEQAVLIAKIVLKRIIEIRGASRAKESIKGDILSNRKPKAIFAVSPATGLDSLINVAKSSFEKEDVVFVCSGENSGQQDEIRRRGFSVALADTPEASKWRPCGEDVQFLKGLWKGLRSVEKLNYFQKLFVYLYTRSALRNLHSYQAFFLDQFKDCGCYIFTGRPRTPFIAGAIIAGQDSNMKVIFVSHTIWYKLPCPIGGLYNLSVFSGAILLTDYCKQEVQRVSPNVQVEVVGMVKPQQKPEDRQLSEIEKKARLRVGMFLGVNDFITEILPRIATLDIDIYLKTRPPGKNAAEFSYLSNLYANVSICDHSNFSMENFCECIDIVVGGYSNAVFQAACLGVPIIGFLTTEERRANEFLSPALIPFDLAVIRASNIEELVAEISRASSSQEYLKNLSESQLQNTETYIPDLDYFPINKLIGR
jgi:hypothetical protein